MLGAIIGDMVGSIYEYTHPRTKNIDMFDIEMRMTDDSYLTIAVARALLNNYPIDYSKEGLEKIKTDLKVEFVDAVIKEPQAGYGGMFYSWALDAKHKKIVQPYNSYGNGSAMRISPVGWAAKTEEELKLLSKTVTEITHNHPEGIKGAEAVALCIFMALHGSSKEEIKKRMISEYYPEISDYNLDYLMENMYDSCSCQDTVPPAIYCFLISESLEDAIKNCIAVGGDCDTTAAMAGSIAEAFYSKDRLSKFEEKFLYLKVEPYVEELIKQFHKKIGSPKFMKKEISIEKYSIDSLIDFFEKNPLTTKKIIFKEFTNLESKFANVSKIQVSNFKGKSTQSIFIETNNSLILLIDSKSLKQSETFFTSQLEEHYNCLEEKDLEHRKIHYIYLLCTNDDLKFDFDYKHLSGIILWDDLLKYRRN